MLKIHMQRSYSYFGHKLVVPQANLSVSNIWSCQAASYSIPIVGLLNKSKCHMDLTYTFGSLLHMHPTRVYLRLVHT